MRTTASSTPETKLARLRAALAAGDGVGALRIAAKFPRLDDDIRDAVRAAWAAFQNRSFYRQLGRDPEALVAAGIAALERKWGTS